MHSCRVDLTDSCWIQLHRLEFTLFCVAEWSAHSGLVLFSLSSLTRSDRCLVSPSSSKVAEKIMSAVNTPQVAEYKWRRRWSMRSPHRSFSVGLFLVRFWLWLWLWLWLWRFWLWRHGPTARLTAQLAARFDSSRVARNKATMPFAHSTGDSCKIDSCKIAMMATDSMVRKGRT